MVKSNLPHPPFQKRRLKKLDWNTLRKLNSEYRGSGVGLGGRLKKKDIISRLLMLKGSPQKRTHIIQKNRSLMKRSVPTPGPLPISKPLDATSPIPSPFPVTTPNALPLQSRRPPTPQARVAFGLADSGGLGGVAAVVVAPPTPSLPEPTVSFLQLLNTGPMLHDDEYFAHRDFVRNLMIPGSESESESSSQTSSDQETQYFTGCMVQGKPDGRCLLRVEHSETGESLRTYDGEFVNGRKHGSGKFTDFVEGFTLLGEFRCGKFVHGHEIRWKEGRVEEKEGDSSSEGPAYAYVLSGPVGKPGHATWRESPMAAWNGYVDANGIFQRADLHLGPPKNIVLRGEIVGKQQQQSVGLSFVNPEEVEVYSPDGILIETGIEWNE